MKRRQALLASLCSFGRAAWLPATGVGVVGTIAVLGADEIEAKRRALASVEGWNHRVIPPAEMVAHDREALRRASGSSLTNADYDWLVGYFAAGVRAYRSPGHALILYPGVPGTRGRRVEGMEGFARSGALLAAWVKTRGDLIPLPDGSIFSAFEHLWQGLSAGTDPASPEFWGWPEDLDQRIVEAGDVALITWLLRDKLREALSAQAQANLMRWLAAVPERHVYGGNWHLFPVMSELARQAWGYPTTRLLAEHFRALKEEHRGEGWFTDGRRFDLYNAWQIHHFLPIIDQMDPQFDHRFIQDALRHFTADFVYFFSPAGFPAFGRSVIYRTALPTPLIHAAASTGTGFAPGQARRALDVTWTHFIRMGALSGGTMTQGYHGPHEAIVENYAGRASSLWGARSLVAAYLQPPDGPIWTAGPQPLPVELGDFDRTLTVPAMRVIGTQSTQVVELRFLNNATNKVVPLEEMGTWRRAAEAALRRPMRPANIQSKYELPSYRSDRPFTQAPPGG